MAASNQNPSEIDRSKNVSNASSASHQAGEQLQELLLVLTELQLLKRAKKEHSHLNLPLSEKSTQRLENERNRQNQQQLSFRIEAPAIEPEIMTDDEEIVAKKPIGDEPGLSKAAKLGRDNGPSEEELEKAVEQFKRLQQLLFEIDVPEFYRGTEISKF
jgi:hypothetical protein